MKWPQKLNEYLRARSSGRFCAFYKGYGHETEECKFFRVEVETLVRMGYLKEFLLMSNTTQKQIGAPVTRTEGSLINFWI